MSKLDIRIFSNDKNGWKSYCAIWSITEEQLANDCCVYNNAIYWKEGVPDQLITKHNPTIRDVYELDCYDLWQCDDYTRNCFNKLKQH